MTPRGRRVHVVDTNVAVVANHRDGGSYACASKCARALLNIKNRGALAIDDGDRILSQYRIYCSVAGQPGPGDSFVRWIHDNRGRLDLVHCVAIRANAGTQKHQFAEFPEHGGLDSFDPADEIFVAVANGHPDKPTILQASDSKWHGWSDALKECGIGVEFLCPEETRLVFARKSGAAEPFP